MGGHSLSFSLSAASLEEMIAPLIAQSMRPVREVLSQSDPPIMQEDVGEIVLVGGSSRIPAVRRALTAEFANSKSPPSINSDINPDTAIAKGAVLTRNCV